jgi:hypothetical protein
MRPNKGYQLIDFMSKARMRVLEHDAYGFTAWSRDRNQGKDLSAEGRPAIETGKQKGTIGGCE